MLAHHQTVEGGVFPYPLFQYLPALLFVKLGLSDTSVYDAFTVISLIAYRALIVLGRWLASQTGRRWLPAAVVVLLTTSLFPLQSAHQLQLRPQLGAGGGVGPPAELERRGVAGTERRSGVVLADRDGRRDRTPCDPPACGGVTQSCGSLTQPAGGGADRDCCS
jgi:hypothetical protein